MGRLRSYSALLLLLPSVSCRGESEAKKCSITVLVAASLNDVIVELAADFERAEDCQVFISAGASGALRKQIELGAPCHVFVSADADQVDALIAKSLCDRETRRIVAANQLVLVVRRELLSQGPWPQSLRSSLIRRLAIADPGVAPAGRYARAALAKEGAWAEMEGKLVISDDVRGAAMHVETSAVDAAIIYFTDARRLKNAVAAHTFPPDSHGPIEYVAGIISSTMSTSRPDTTTQAAARRFLNHVTSPQAAVILRKHGFTPPSGDHPAPSDSE